jgi:hypothetical protein
MKLSEALALGIPEIKISNSHGWYSPNENDGQCHGCLVGAALYAQGAERCDSLKRFVDMWPWVKNIQAASCPACDLMATKDENILVSHGSIIPHMFTHLVNHYERGEITTEQIADYVRSIEPPDVVEEVSTTPTEEYVSQS